MANLLGNNIGSNYRGILNIGSTINTPLGSTLSTITDGMGNNSTLQLSTSLTKIDSNLITGGATDASARLHVRGDGTNPIFRVEDNSGAAALTVENSRNVTVFTTISTPSINIRGTEITVGGGGGGGNTGVQFNVAGLSTATYTSGNGGALGMSQNITMAAGSGNWRGISAIYTINNSGAQTGTATGIFLNATETALNGMGHSLMDLQIGGSSKFRVRNNNNIDIFSNTQLNWSTYNAYIYHDGSSFLFSTPQSIVFSAYSNLYKFGGATNLFPALKRNGSNIEFRLADDTGYTGVVVGGVNTSVEAFSIKIGAAYSSLWGAGGNLTSKGSGKFGDTNGYDFASASAILQADSTTRGFLPPRMTTAQKNAITLPATGLVVFDTDLGKLCVFTTVWETVTSA